MHLEQSLRHASVGAERASQAKSEFLSRMSHELRTPLNAILGFAQLLELDELPADQASSVDQIQVAGRHLLALINEVLDISRIEAGRVSLSTEPVEVGDVLDEVATLLAPVAEASDVELSVDTDAPRALRVYADRQRLVQILLNLGSNAVKYNSRGGSVAFRTGTGDSGRVRLEVRDTGPGIPHEQQDQLFVPFSRLGAERSGRRGHRRGPGPVEATGGGDGGCHRRGVGARTRLDLLGRAPARRAPRARRGRCGAPCRSMPPTARDRNRWGSRQADPGPGRLPSPSPNGARAPEVQGGGVVVLQIEDNPSNAAAGRAGAGQASRGSAGLGRGGPVRAPSWPASTALTWSSSTSTCPTCAVTSCSTGSRPCLSWPTPRLSW